MAAWNLSQTHFDGPDPAPRPEGQFATQPAAAGDLPGTVALPDAPVVRIAIPHDLESLPLEARIAWRAATRKAFTHYLGRGYGVVGFQRARDGQAPYYELAH